MDSCAREVLLIVQQIDEDFSERQYSLSLHTLFSGSCLVRLWPQLFSVHFTEKAISRDLDFPFTS